MKFPVRLQPALFRFRLVDIHASTRQMSQLIAPGVADDCGRSTEDKSEFADEKQPDR
ncbi:hypothetical protein IWQ48_004717 [Labrenzia sp. EL_13]|nr:hypothetical protein [Labrenzia sp. EL_13]